MTKFLKRFFFVSQVLSFRLKKQTNKNVADATFKEANNGAIICEHYYVDVILEKVGIIGEENKTYTESNGRKFEIKCRILKEIRIENY